MFYALNYFKNAPALWMVDGATMQVARICSKIAMAMVLQILLALILQEDSELFKAPMVAKVLGQMACVVEVIHWVENTYFVYRI